MNLEDFLNKNNTRSKEYIKKQATSVSEISDLFKIVTRDIKDCETNKELSLDWQFGIAYNAGLKLCTILVRSEGLRISGGPHHFMTFKLLPWIMGKEKVALSKYFDRCRIKRNKVEYESVGGINEDEVVEIISSVKKLKLDEVEEWLYKNHNNLMES